MSYPNKVLVKREVLEPAEFNPFSMAGVRELARQTGLDAGYLSRVKNGKIPISPKRLHELLDAADLLRGMA